MKKRVVIEENFWDIPLQDLLELLDTNPSGITTEEANQRLIVYGPNRMAKEGARLRLDLQNRTYYIAGERSGKAWKVEATCWNT